PFSPLTCPSIAPWGSSSSRTSVRMVLSSTERSSLTSSEYPVSFVPAVRMAMELWDDLPILAGFKEGVLDVAGKEAFLFHLKAVLDGQEPRDRVFAVLVGLSFSLDDARSDVLVALLPEVGCIFFFEVDAQD